MKKLTLAIVLALTGCSPGVSYTDGGAAVVSDGSANRYALQIVEKDGYKFAVLVGSYGCAITQVTTGK